MLYGPMQRLVDQDGSLRVPEDFPLARAGNSPGILVDLWEWGDDVALDEIAPECELYFRRMQKVDVNDNVTKILRIISKYIKLK